MGRTIKALALLLGLWPGLAGAVDCSTVAFEDVAFTVCEVDPGADELRLFLRDGAGEILGTFHNVERMLAREGNRLGFAMNAGMYHADRTPVGLYIEDGKEEARLLVGASAGNFGLLPNGVLCLGDGRARVIETRRFGELAPPCRYATQSGPMLVIDNALHPRFLPDSRSVYIRNGVGIRGDGVAVFAMSEEPVTFHRFARLFRDRLRTPQALYLDGNISRLFAPSLGRSDPGFPMGPIVGVVE